MSSRANIKEYESCLEFKLKQIVVAIRICLPQHLVSC